MTLTAETPPTHTYMYLPEIRYLGKAYMYMHSDNVLLVLLLYLSHICIIIRMRLPSTEALSR